MRLAKLLPKKRSFYTLIKYSLLLVISLFFLFPIYLLLRNAFSQETEITGTHWYFLPARLHWENFTELFNDPGIPFLHSLGNSLIIASCQTIGILVISSLAGYGFARYKSKLSQFLWQATLISLMIPTAACFVPSYILLSDLHMLDTLSGLIMPSLFQAFSVVMFRQFFSQFPPEIEEAAKLDGLSQFAILRKIIFPNAIPIFASLGVLIFLESWNSFLWPFIVASDPSNWTVQLSLSTFLTSQSANFSELFAGTTISLLPALLVFFSFSRYMVSSVDLTSQN